MSQDLRLGTIAGFRVKLNWSVLIALALIAWVLADGILPESVPGRRASAYWLGGVAGAALLIGSLLAHELAHAIVARRSGVEVEDVTLWMFGGIASLKEEAREPRADLRIAVVGPLASLALGVAFGLAWWGLAAGPGWELPAAVAGWLATANAVLAVFNLIPGAPLDGGRVLRAWLWARHGDRERAAETAIRGGEVVGYVLAGFGLMSVVAGDAVGGLWMVLIGWFVLAAARAERTSRMTDRVLRGVTVAEVMSSPVSTAPAWLTVTDYLDRHVLHGHHSACPVQDLDGRVVGLVALEQVRTVPPARRQSTRLGAIAVPSARVPTAAPTDPLGDLLPRLTPEAGRRALVFDGGRLVGIVTPADVSRVVEAKALLRTAV
jgi:Zn-dependent protease